MTMLEIAAKFFSEKACRHIDGIIPLVELSDGSQVCEYCQRKSRELFTAFAAAEIEERVVEAAARGIFEHDKPTFMGGEEWPWDHPRLADREVSYIRENYRKQARAALLAAFKTLAGE